MVRIVSSSLALLLSSWSVLAAAQNAAPAPAPAPRAPGAAPAAQPAQPAAPGTQIPTTLAPATTPGAVGPEAPVGKVTLSLEKRLQDMMKGNGLTAAQVA